MITEVIKVKAGIHTEAASHYSGNKGTLTGVLEMLRKLSFIKIAKVAKKETVKSGNEYGSYEAVFADGILWLNNRVIDEVVKINGLKQD